MLQANLLPAALIWEIIAVDASQHNIVKAPCSHSFGNILRLIWVERRRSPGSLDSAEPTTSGASVAHQHDGCSGCVPIAAPPALPDIGAPSQGSS